MQSASFSLSPVLVADEQPVSRNLLVTTLAGLGYAVEPLAVGGDVLQRLPERRFALMLISDTLPDMAAPELLAQIRHQGVATPVIVIGEDGKRTAAGLPTGACGRIGRPIDPARLPDLVREAGAAPGMTDFREPGEPTLDLEHLNGFTEGDRQLERELFELFLSSADGYLERMADALAAGHPWHGTAHALKGASANLGARRLATLAQAAERLEPDLVLLETIRGAVGEIRQLFQSRQA